MAGKYQLVTLGCKVNQYESQQIREVLHSLGLEPAGHNEDADIAIVNTCAVTTCASRKNRQAVRRVARARQIPVIVVGCGVSADTKRLSALPNVRAVFGHDGNICAELRNCVPGLLPARLTRVRDHSVGRAKHTQERPDIERNDLSMIPGDGQPSWSAPTSKSHSSPSRIVPCDVPLVKPDDDLTADRIESFAGHQRAFLKVQDGCDAFCTYCIIPRLRPRLRSKPVDVAVAEAQDLVRAGHKEIIVTGIFLGAYGRETALRKRWGRQKSPLSALADALSAVEGLERLRFSSLEPGDVDDALLEVLGGRDCCVPHLHLPLQSGSGAILQRMNRQYTADDFVKTVDRVRAALDRPAISTDIIVGFPGETEDDFERSIEIARYAGFCKIHAFPYSSREKTAAARWTDQFVHPGVVRERMNRLAEVERELSLAFRSRFIGHVERVIVEGSEDRSHRVHDSLAGSPASREIRHGRADRYFEIHFEAAEVHAGDLVSVRIDRVTPTRTHGGLATYQHLV